MNNKYKFLSKRATCCPRTVWATGAAAPSAPVAPAPLLTDTDVSFALTYNSMCVMNWMITRLLEIFETTFHQTSWRQ